MNCSKPEFQIMDGLARPYTISINRVHAMGLQTSLFQFAKEIDYLFSSPFDSTAVDFRKLDAPAYKIASFKLLTCRS